MFLEEAEVVRKANTYNAESHLAAKTNNVGQLNLVCITQCSHVCYRPGLPGPAQHERLRQTEHLQCRLKTSHQPPANTPSQGENRGESFIILRRTNSQDKT